ncbi:hypothetical protein D3C81_1813050 [compost metagenome]
MEHPPVEELAAYFRGTFQQTETVRVDELKRQQLSQLRCAARILPIDANSELPLPLPGNTQVAAATLGQLHFAKHGTGRLFVLDDRVQPGAAK